MKQKKRKGKKRKDKGRKEKIREEKKRYGKKRKGNGRKEKKMVKSMYSRSNFRLIAIKNFMIICPAFLRLD